MSVSSGAARASTSDFERVLVGYAPPDGAEIARLEQAVWRQLRAPDEDHLKLLGYGEFTIAVAHPASQPKWACKRLPPSNEAAAQRFGAHIRRYIAMLEGADIRVVPTELHVTPAAAGGYALYLSQPILPSETLVPNILRRRAPNADDEVLNAVIAAIRRGCTPTFGVDGHVANWAWLDGEPWNLDISTPFNQGPDERPELDVRLLIQPYPALVRPLLRWVVAPPLLRRYYDLRLTLLEFCGMLHKEGLRHWIPAAVDACNQVLDTPITTRAVEKAYADDVALFGLIYRMKRVERWTKQLLGQTYQFLIEPPIDRYGRKHAPPSGRAAEA